MNAQELKIAADLVKRKYPAVAVMVDCFIQGVADSVQIPCCGRELEVYERLEVLLRTEAKRIGDAFDSLGLSWIGVTSTEESQKFINEAIYLASFNPSGEDGLEACSGPH